MKRIIQITSAAIILLSTNVYAEKLNFDFYGVSTVEALQGLAKMKGHNLILAEGIGGRLDIRLRGVTWEEAWEAIILKKELSYRILGHQIWVGTHQQLKQRLLQEQELKKLVQSSNLGDLPRQVMIEARIVEAQRHFARNLGSKLNYQQGSSRQSQSDLKAQGLNGYEAATTIGILGKEAAALLQIELSALEAEGLGQIVSNPRVMAADNTQALIEQGTELPYQSSAGQGATKVQFRKANLRLQVKPSIMKDRAILLDVDINKDSVGLKTEQGFAIDTKHLKTQVMVESGGTVILGGIFQEAERQDETAIPWISKIPILGYLFKQEAKSKDKTELLIFLTPTLVNSPNPQ